MHFIPHLEKDIRRHWSGLAHNPTSHGLLQSQAGVKGQLALNPSAQPVMAKIQTYHRVFFLPFSVACSGGLLTF